MNITGCKSFPGSHKSHISQSLETRSHLTTSPRLKAVGISIPSLKVFDNCACEKKTKNNNKNQNEVIVYVTQLRKKQTYS